MTIPVDACDGFNVFMEGAEIVVVFTDNARRRYTWRLSKSVASDLGRRLLQPGK
jgi:hypothetical protein